MPILERQSVSGVFLPSFEGSPRQPEPTSLRVAHREEAAFPVDEDGRVAPSSPTDLQAGTELRAFLTEAATPSARPRNRASAGDL
jgi:hypothetical protein